MFQVLGVQFFDLVCMKNLVLFGILLSEGLVGNSNQFLWFIAERKKRNRRWC